MDTLSNLELAAGQMIHLGVGDELDEFELVSLE